MRIRAGIVLVKEDRVALIERFRAGLHYFIFPGGGVDAGESPERAAIREAFEELGIEVVIRQKVAEVQLGQKSRQIYFLVEQTGGEFGTGAGEEFAASNRDNPQKGIYLPIWMPVVELSQHVDVHPAQLAKLVIRSRKEGWPTKPASLFENQK